MSAITPEDQFRQTYGELYSLIKPLIKSIPDFRSKETVQRFEKIYAYESDNAKWFALLEELDYISTRESIGEKTDSILLEKAQDEDYWTFINRPTIVKNFTVEYPTLSWILTVLKQEWRLIMVGSGTVDFLEKINPKLPMKDVKDLFGEVRDVKTLDILLKLYKDSSVVKKLEENEAKAPKKPGILVNAASHKKLASYIVINRSLIKSGMKGHSYYDSPPPIIKIDLQLGLQTKNYKIKNIMLRHEIIGDVPSTNEEFLLLVRHESVYWDYAISIVERLPTIAAETIFITLTYNKKERYRLIRTSKETKSMRLGVAVTLLAAQNGIGSDKDADIGTQIIAAVGHNNRSELAAIDFITGETTKLAVWTAFDHILSNCDQIIRDILISKFVGIMESISIYYPRIFLVYASDDLLVGLWPTLEKITVINHGIWMQELLRRGRGDILVTMAYQSDDPTNLHRLFSMHDPEEFTRYLITQKHMNLISITTLQKIFMKSLDIYILTTLIELNNEMLSNKFLTENVISECYSLATKRKRYDICEYLQQISYEME